MARRAQIAVIGRGKPDAELEQLAEEVGRRVAESGAVVVCGELGGVMEAVARGAHQAGGDVIGIVPGEAPSDANDHVTHVVASGIGYGRNLSVVASADAVIAVGGEWGTLSEIAFACRLPRPVIALQSWTVTAAKPIGGPGIEEATDAAEAVEAALRRVRPGNG